MDRYSYGARPTVEVTFRDEADVLTDPSTVVFAYQRPDGTETTNQAPTSNPSIGVYRFQMPACTQAGEWTWRVSGTGPGSFVAPTEGTFEIEPTRFRSP